MEPVQCDHGWPCQTGHCLHQPYPQAWAGLGTFLRGLSATLTQKPRAVLVISGHWEENPVQLNVLARPPLLFDYYGFPQHTYHLRYPAPGDPVLAQQIQDILVAAGFPTALESRRGLDHGVFIPFLLAYPNADMPIVQLSLKAGLSATEHLRLGEALAPLRSQGVLIVGSGMSFHNLRELRRRLDANSLIPQSEAFDAALTKVVCTSDPLERNAALAQWESLPCARFSHPREEHLLPLMVAAGAAGNDSGERVFSGLAMGSRISGFRFGAG
jgi:aromatic ring-opening dioxygenase catalytic subunit (LigB family)